MIYIYNNSLVSEYHAWLCWMSDISHIRGSIYIQFETHVKKTTFGLIILHRKASLAHHLQSILVN